MLHFRLPSAGMPTWSRMRLSGSATHARTPLSSSAPHWFSFDLQPPADPLQHLSVLTCSPAACFTRRALLCCPVSFFFHELRFYFHPLTSIQSKPKDLISKFSQIVDSCYCHRQTVPKFLIPKLALLRSQSLLPLRFYFPTLKNLLCIVRLCSSTLSSGFVNCSPDMV